MKKRLLLFASALVLGFWICIPAQVGITSINRDSANLTETVNFKQIVVGVRSIPNPLFLAIYLAEIADLTWRVDEKFARDLFYSALSKLSTDKKEDSKETDASFRKILSLISKHDKKWARTLLESRSENSNWKAHANLEIAENLMESDPTVAADFAHQSLQFDTDPAFVSFLKRLRQQNPSMADRLFLQAISQNSRRLDANSFAFLGTYLFTSPQTGFQDLQTISVTRVGNIFVPNVSVNRPNIPANLVQNYLQNAIVILNSPSDNPDERAFRYAFGNLLLPKAYEFAPGLIGPLGGAMAPLASTISPEFTSADAYKNIFKKPYASPQARMKDIEKEADSYTRDRLFLDLVFQAYQKNDFTIANAAVAKIEDMQVRSELESLITFREGTSLLNGNQTDLVRSMQIASKIRNTTEKCLLWLGISVASNKAKQDDLAIQSLIEALECTRQLQNENAPYLLLYIASQKKSTEPAESNLVLAEAIRSFNKFEELPDPDLVHKVALDPVTLPFSIEVDGVNLGFRNTIEKFLGEDDMKGFRIIEEFADDRLRGMGYVMLAKLIVERKKHAAFLNKQNKVVRVGEDGIRKSAAKSVMPVYPKESSKNRIQGVAVSEIQYDSNGNVEEIKIIQSPDNATAKSVENALRQWKFTPSRLDNDPVSIRGKLTFYFILDAKGIGKVENPKQFQ